MQSLFNIITNTPHTSAHKVVVTRSPARSPARTHAQTMTTMSVIAPPLAKLTANDKILVEALAGTRRALASSPLEYSPTHVSSIKFQALSEV